jgi:Spy/CpxP family protein refolding chaperone
MKTKIVNMAGKAWLVATVLLISVHAEAQCGPQNGPRPGRGQGLAREQMSIPNLTDDQIKQIKGLRASHQRSFIDNRNDLNIKRAELQKLMTAEKPDMDQINSTLDAMGKIRTNMLKERAALHMDIRNLLTPDQKTAWDTRVAASFNGFGRRFQQGSAMPGRGMHRFAPGPVSDNPGDDPGQM